MQKKKDPFKLSIKELSEVMSDPESRKKITSGNIYIDKIMENPEKAREIMAILLIGGMNCMILLSKFLISKFGVGDKSPIHQFMEKLNEDPILVVFEDKIREFADAINPQDC